MQQGAREGQLLPELNPSCNYNIIQEEDLIQVVKTESNESGKPSIIVLRRNDFRSSTKLDALIRDLRSYISFLSVSGILNKTISYF